MKLTKKIQKAINLSVNLHEGQKRKGRGGPYALHPFSVAWILSSYTEDEDVIAAGLLHDILEDVEGYSKEDMTKDFGEKVTEIVLGVTEDKDPANTWEERKEAYVNNLKIVSQESLIVCAADKIHNMQTTLDDYEVLGEEAFKVFTKPKEKTIWFYREVLNVLRERLKSDILKECEEVYKKLESLL